MPGIRKILFPVDFSQRSIGAARYVECFAGWFDAEILLLHVMDAASAESGQEQLQSFLSGELKQFSTRRVCTTGDPADEIVKMVRSWAPDLVMMPTYGMGFYRPYLLGSVTAKVLHDVDCPVWTAVHAEAAPPLEKITLSRVLCALDLGQRSPRVLEWAAWFAKQHQGSLGLVHATAIVEPVPGAQPAGVLEQELADFLAAEARGGLAILQRAAGTNAMVLVNGGEPSKVAACAVKDLRAGLLVIGRHSGRGANGNGYLRHTAYEIIRESPCPVISI